MDIEKATEILLTLKVLIKDTPLTYRAGGDRYPPEGRHFEKRTFNTSTAQPVLDTIQGEEEFLSHDSTVAAKIEMDRAMRGARRASIQELANVLTIQDDKDLNGESYVPDLVQNNDEGRGGRGARRWTGSVQWN
jgi:hypothetical protein